MHLIESVLILITLVVLSNIISHFLVKIPVSLIQIIMGLVLALAIHWEIPLKTDWFLLLFIAPLLYNDGREFPRDELWNLRGPIIGNAILLVFATMLVGGGVIHLLIPQLPLAACFALAAILSPTDPVAVQSIAKQAHLPDRVLHLVSGESLINDASGLIGFKYGLAAAMTGVFSLTQAVGDFFYMSLVGAVIGLLLEWLFHSGQNWLLNTGVDDVVLHVISQLLVPFIIYFVAEEAFHASGVIAVVVGGLLHAWHGDRQMMRYSELSLLVHRTWHTVVYVLNGLLFLILGVEIAIVMRGAIRDDRIHNGLAIVDVVVVWLVLLIVRMGWTAGYLLVSRIKHREQTPISIRALFVSGLSGVRGVITLAGVLSVPTALANGQPFPQRSLMLFVAAGVILMSLLAAILFIPLLLNSDLSWRFRGSSTDDESQTQPDPLQTKTPEQVDAHRVQLYLYQRAIGQIEVDKTAENERAAKRLIREYHALMDQERRSSHQQQHLPHLVTVELNLRMVALNGERLTLQQLWRDNRILARNYRLFTEELELQQIRLTRLYEGKRRRTWRMYIHLLKRNLPQLLARFFIVWGGYQDTFYNEMFFIDKELAKGGLKYLSHYLKQPDIRSQKFDRQLIYRIVILYRNRIDHINELVRKQNEAYQEQFSYLRERSLIAQRSALQELREQGKISGALAKTIRQRINYTENVTLNLDHSAK